MPAETDRSLLRRVAALLWGLVAVAAGVLLLLRLGGGEDSTFRGTLIEPPMEAPGFALSDQHGHRFRLADARGKVVVLTFLYTSCTDVCPVVGVKLRETAELLGEEAAEVAFVVVSVDPARDTPERVAAYSRALGMDERWHYLIGSPEELQPVWEAYFVGEPTVSEEAEELFSEEQLREGGLYRGLGRGAERDARRVRDRFGGGHDVGHATPVWVIDPQGRIRVKHGVDLDPADLASDIRLLLSG